MSDPDWLSYAGVITGIAGATMGYISYRRTGKMKTLDLRLELRKAVNDLRSSVESLPSLLGSTTMRQGKRLSESTRTWSPFPAASSC